MGRKPRGNRLHSLFGRGRQGIDFRLGHVLAVVGVVRGAHLQEALLELLHVLLLETDVHVDLLVGGSIRVDFPALGDHVKRLLQSHLKVGRRGNRQSGKKR